MLGNNIKYKYPTVQYTIKNKLKLIQLFTTWRKFSHVYSHWKVAKRKKILACKEFQYSEMSLLRINFKLTCSIWCWNIMLGTKGRTRYYPVITDVYYHDKQIRTLSLTRNISAFKEEKQRNQNDWLLLLSCQKCSCWYQNALLRQTGFKSVCV